MEKFNGFRGSIGNSEIACAIGLGHARLLSNCKYFPVNYSLVLQLQNFSTLNDLQYNSILQSQIIKQLITDNKQITDINQLKIICGKNIKSLYHINVGVKKENINDSNIVTDGQC